MNENKITPAMLAQTPPTFDEATLPMYNPELQYRVYTGNDTMAEGWAYTTQTFDKYGEPKDGDQD